MDASVAESPGSPSRRRVRSRRAAVAGIVAAGVAVAITVWALGGLGSPASGPSTVTLSGYSTTNGNCSDIYCPAVVFGEDLLPSWVNVSVLWIDVSHGQAALRVWGPGGTQQFPCGSPGAAGECAFGSQGGNYTFVASSSSAQYGQQVNYTLTYSR